jgi:hypothetical protein
VIIIEKVLAMSARLTASERDRAAAILRTLLSNPEQSEKQQAGLKEALRILGYSGELESSSTSVLGN